MKLSFVGAAAIRREPADWGVVGWLCKPAITGASKLAIVEATFSVGRGHAFHMHPLQEEVIYVLEGEIEQWVGEEEAHSGPGRLRLHSSGSRSCIFLRRRQGGQDPGDLRPLGSRGFPDGRGGGPRALEKLAAIGPFTVDA